MYLENELHLAYGIDPLGTVFITKDNHRYCRGENCEIPYTSVSEVINKYKIPYNANYWSKYKAYQRILMNRISLDNPKIVEPGLEKRSKARIKELLLEYAINNAPNLDSPDYTPLEDIDALNYAIERDEVNSQELFSQREIILDSWRNKKDTASNKGNVYHRAREINAITNGYELNAFDLRNYRLHLDELLKAYKIEDGAHSSPSEALIWSLDFSEEKRVITDDPYHDLPDGFYPELIISDDEYRVAGTADRVFFETILGQRFVDIDDYKGFALDTPIATETSWKNIGEIIVGDKIFDGEGNLTKVKHVSKIHYNPCYEIVFDTGDKLVCDHEHRWVITKRLRGGSLVDMEITTDEMFDLFNKQTKTSDRIKIKCVSINTSDKDLPIDPYILGVWLGDGSRCAGTITNTTEEVWKEIEARGYKTGEDISSVDGACTKTIFKISSELKNLNLIKNKHIPDIYLRSSYNQRLDLLRGFMDADGHFNRARKRCVMNTTKPSQVDMLVTLISSLGFKPTVLPYKGSGFNKTFEGYAICFTPSENPFLARNKDYLEIMKDAKPLNKFRMIYNIKKIETAPTKCLAVESENHTYLAGKSFIKTHNTNADIPKKSFYVRGQGYKMMGYPVNHLMDCKHSYYNLQTSIYAYMLERKGFTVRRTGYHHLNALNDCEYLRQEAKDVLEDFSNMKQENNFDNNKI